MTDFGDFLRRLVERLDEAGIPYMLAGSVASTFHGIPRSTQDVNVIVTMAAPELKRLIRSLPPGAYYVSDDAAQDALRRRSQFNVIDLETGWKADLIVRKERPFSESEFQRRVHAEVLGVEAWVATAEDTIVAKLEWAKRAGGSERQLRDVAGIVEVVGVSLDRAYIQRWVDELGVEDLWLEADAKASR